MSEIKNSKYWPSAAAGKHSPLDAPYGLEQKLAIDFYSRVQWPIDTAADGMEVTIIRTAKCRSDWYYQIEVNLARYLHYREVEHILEVERKFIQEVEAHESIRRIHF
jgi:hypothetical protein